MQVRGFLSNLKIFFNKKKKITKYYLFKSDNFAISI